MPDTKKMKKVPVAQRQYPYRQISVSPPQLPSSQVVFQLFHIRSPRISLIIVYVGVYLIQGS
jgi:hypothetical protein